MYMTLMSHNSTDSTKFVPNNRGVMKWVSRNAASDAVTQHWFLSHNSNVTE